MSGPADLRARLAARLDPPAAAWLEGARAAVAAEPAALRTLFPVVARRVGRGPLEPGRDGAWDRTVDEAARVVLLDAAGLRYVLDVVPLDASWVRGSHGRLPDDPGDGPVLLCSEPGARDGLHARDVRGLLLELGGLGS